MQITTILQQAEEVITQGLQGFKEAGKALMDIRDGELYKDKYQTFEEYIQKRWGWERAHAYRLINAAQVSINLSPIGDISNEGQARELVKLESAELQRAAYGVAETIAAQNEKGKVTAKDVKKAVELVHQVIKNNPSIQPENIAKAAIEAGSNDDIEEEYTAQDQFIDELRSTIISLSTELESFKNRVTTDQIEPRLKELSDENHRLKIINQSLIKARDQVMNENAQMRKQLLMMKKAA